MANQSNSNIEEQDKKAKWKKYLPSITTIIMIVYFIISLLLGGGFGSLTRRGFFCDDSSITYPFKTDTIGIKTLLFVSLIMPSFIIKCCDILLIKQLKKLPIQGKSALYNRFHKWRRKKLSDNVLEIDAEEMDLISSNLSENVKRRQLISNENSSDCEVIQCNSNGLHSNNNSPVECENHFNNDSEIESNDDDDDEVNLFSSVPLDSDNNNYHRNNELNINNVRQLSMIGTIPNYVESSFGECQLYFFGFNSSMLFTGIGKITLARLRPHFMQKCLPNIDCSLSQNWNKYIEDFTCTNNLSPREYSYITTSWPSGHASAMFFSMIYLIIYLNTTVPILVFLGRDKLKKRFDPLILYGAYVILIGLAGYIALTRVSDYHHHPLDVLSGSVIGAITAIATSKSILSRQYTKLIV